MHRLTQKIHVRGSLLAAFILALTAIAGGLLIHPLLGLLLFFLAWLSDAKYRTAHICEACGNELAATSTLCPACQTPLTPEPLQRHLGRSALRIALLFLIIGGGIFAFILIATTRT